MERSQLSQYSQARALSPQAADQPQPNPWLAQLPFALYFIWMVYKQRWALAAVHMAPGPYMLWAAIGSLLVLLPWVRLVRGRKQLTALLLLDLLLTAIMYADILYFRQFGDLVSIASLRFVTQLGSVSGAVTVLMHFADLRLWIDLPVLGALLLAPAHWRRQLATNVRGRTAGALALVGFVAVTASFVADPYMSEQYYGHSMVGSRMGLLNYHAFDIGTYVERLSLRLKPNSGPAQEVKAWFAARSAHPTPPSPLAGIARGKNVIMIQVESLQAFTLGLKVNGQEVTPNLNRLARESLNYKDFYSQTGQGVTADADLLGNCSLHPTRTGAVYFDYATNDFRCMPQVLREAGYHAYAFQGMPPDFWNLATVYPKLGFEHFYSGKEYDQSERIGIGLSDESFFKQTLPMLKSLPEPYYAYLVTLTSHGNFDFKGLPRPLNLGTLEGTVAGHYLHAVHYTDGAIGHFLDALKAEGLLDRSVIVLYGDHAGVFSGNSGMAEALKVPEGDTMRWFQAERRIPFLVRLPGGAQAGERLQTAGQADIAPTLGELLGVPTQSAFFMGRSVLAQQDGATAFYNGAATDDRYLYFPDGGGPTPGRCWEKTNGSEVDVSACQTLAERSRDRLRISRLMVEWNLISHMGK